MRVWYFSEMAYHPAWEEGLKRGSLRVVLPNSNYDPQVGHGLLNRYLDEFALCDEVGLDIMVNEHHSTSTCLTDLGADGAGGHRARDQARRGCCRSARRSPTGPTRCASPRRWPGSTYCRAAGWRWAWSRARPTRSRRPTATRPI